MNDQIAEAAPQAAGQPRGITYDEVVTFHAEAKDNVSKVAARWALGLAVGNGAGLVAISSQIISNLDKPSAYLLFPSAWLFTIGLCVIGAAPGLANWRAALYVNDLSRVRQDVWLGKPAALKTAKPKMLRTLFILETGAEILSGALFAAGLIYPLLVLSHRYICTGSFA
ncbi:hypothetical protein [Brevundimonas naejangsanensis]|uniref:hypothetical protein n=1 Tax=Brevundimonas naejangsanensis TaxID=588932 RepID=UPI00320990E0